MMRKNFKTMKKKIIKWPMNINQKKTLITCNLIKNNMSIITQIKKIKRFIQKDKARFKT